MSVSVRLWPVAKGEFLTELAGDLKQWMAERGLWWAASVVVHAVFLSAALLLLGTIVSRLPAKKR